MSEDEYILVTNLAKLRIAAAVLREVVRNYGAASQERLAAITSPLASLIDDCSIQIETDDE